MSGEVELKLGRAQDVLPGSERRFDALFCDPPRAQLHGRKSADHVDLAEFVNICDSVWDLLKPDAGVAVWSRPEDRRDLDAQLRRMELVPQGEVVWNQMSHKPVTSGVAYQHEYVLLYSLTNTPP